MRGEVLKPDGLDGPGLILGEDGKRYYYTAARVHRGTVLAAGSAVDFIGLGEDARDIYPLGGVAAVSAAPAGVNIDAAYKPAVAARNDGLFTYFLRAMSKNYFQFYGRARRAEYWGYTLFLLLSLVVLFVVDALISAFFFNNSVAGEPVFWPILTVLFYLFNVIPSIAITIRRLHDQDMTGWLYLINFIPYIGGIIIFILMFFDSRPNPNKHGASPKYGAAQTIQVFS